MRTQSESSEARIDSTPARSRFARLRSAAAASSRGIAGRNENAATNGSGGSWTCHHCARSSVSNSSSPFGVTSYVVRAGRAPTCSTETVRSRPSSVSLRNAW